MRCSEIMKTKVECVRPGDSAQTAAVRMRDNNIGFLPVCDDDGKVLGAVTDRDLAIRICAEDRLPSGVKASEVMTSEIVSCGPDDDVREAEALMAEYHKSRIMICDDDGTILGVISLSDVAEREQEESEVARTVREVASREVRT